MSLFHVTGPGDCGLERTWLTQPLTHDTNYVLSSSSVPGTVLDPPGCHGEPAHMGPALLELTNLGPGGIWWEQCSEKVTFKLRARGSVEEHPGLGQTGKNIPCRGSHVYKDRGESWQTKCGKEENKKNLTHWWEQKLKQTPLGNNMSLAR